MQGIFKWCCVRDVAVRRMFLCGRLVARRFHKQAIAIACISLALQVCGFQPDFGVVSQKLFIFRMFLDGGVPPVSSKKTWFGCAQNYRMWVTNVDESLIFFGQHT